MMKGVLGLGKLKVLGLLIAVITLISGQAVADSEKGQQAFSAGYPKIRFLNGNQPPKAVPENFDGEWRWSIDWMASACVGTRTEPMTVRDNKFTTTITHAADSQVGWTTGKIDPLGKTSFFAAGQYIGAQFNGKFVGDKATGVVVAQGEVVCHGTWKATKIK